MADIVTLFWLPTDNWTTYEPRHALRVELTQVTLALALYRAEHGTLLQKLEELTLQYLARVPQDRFRPQPIQYPPQSDGFTVYSVGVNGVDDRGAEIAPHDDIVARVRFAPGVFVRDNK